MRALLLLCFLVALVAGQTIPAVYYKLYYINRDDQNGINRIETIDANGGGQATIASPGALLSDSIAFDGTYLYVIEGGNQIKWYTPSVPSMTDVLYTDTIRNLTCLGLGRRPDAAGVDQTTLFFGVAPDLSNNTSPEAQLFSAPLHKENNTLGPITMVATWLGGSCRYVVQTEDIVYWTGDGGRLWSWNSSSPLEMNATLVSSASPGNLTGALTAASTTNSLLFGANERQIRANNLEQLQLKQPGEPEDRLWTTLLGNSTNGLITMNGAVVASTDLGIIFWFGPFSETDTDQTQSRQILADVSTIRGLATDGASALATSMLVLAATMIITLLML